MKWTTCKIKQLKGKQKIVCLTAGDYSMARIIDAAGVQLVLVGDSLAMTMLGYENTLPVTMVEMLQLTAAVVRGTKEALVVADMPFMSYQVSIEDALYNAGRFLQEAGAQGVKLEGGREVAELLCELTLLPLVFPFETSWLTFPSVTADLVEVLRLASDPVPVVD